MAMTAFLCTIAIDSPDNSGQEDSTIDSQSAKRPSHIEGITLPNTHRIRQLMILGLFNPPQTSVEKGYYV